MNRLCLRRSSGIRAWVAAVELLFIALAVGCQTQVQKQTTLPPQVRVSTGGNPQNSPQAESSSKDDPIGSDPCASRLHNISGQILMYYAVNGRLPNALPDLKTVADVDDQTDYTCPVSHQPYTYVPNGMQLQTGGPRLIALDSTPAHNGFRWGILFMTPKGKQPATTWVIKLNDALLAQYSSQSPPSSAPAVPARR